MKKTFLSFALMAVSTLAAHAHKAWPYPITFVQSNGDTIIVRMHGDDHLHWYTDMAGNILERHGNNFIKTNLSESDFLHRAHQSLKAKAIRREPIATSANLFPHIGSPKVVVILAQYKDLAFSVKNPRASFEQYLNATNGHPQNLGNREDMNYGSVKQYFTHQSGGKFTPQFDIYGPVTLPHNMAHYGGISDNASDEKYRELLTDACTAMDDSLDFSPYDQDNDGNIDLVYIIYAGYGQSNGAAAETMWPRRFPGFSNPRFDGKGINQGGISNELFGREKTPADKRINGIGLFCHEFSHCLGLPDFYPTNNITNADNLGMEDWDLMDNGEYVAYGYCPISYTAWEREAMGWDIIPAITEAKQYKLDGSITGGTNAVKIENPNNKNEYFVLQHFEDTGWNQGIAKYKSGNTSFNPETKGLLIYHVDYRKDFFGLYANKVNNDKTHPRMTIIPADGRLVSSYKINNGITPYDYARQLHGDIFRSNPTSNNPIFVQGMGLPNDSWWTQANNTPIYNVKYCNGAMYFDFIDPDSNKAIAPTAIDINPYSPARIYTIDGRFVGTSTSTLPHGIYIRDGKKFVK